MPRPKRSALPKATLNNKEGSNAAHGFDESLATAMEQIRAGQSLVGLDPHQEGGGGGGGRTFRFERRNNLGESSRTDKGAQDSPKSLDLLQLISQKKILKM